VLALLVRYRLVFQNHSQNVTNPDYGLFRLLCLLHIVATRRFAQVEVWDNHGSVRESTQRESDYEIKSKFETLDTKYS